MENNQISVENFEIVKFGPYRFIGKSVYAGNKGWWPVEILDARWTQKDRIFKMLDDMEEYASDDVTNAALATWDKYDDKDELVRYTVGRFMKPDTPVPQEMDYYDIPEVYIAKAWMKEKLDINSSEVCLVSENAVTDIIKKTGKYKDAPWMFAAEIYPKPDETDTPIYGSYCACGLSHQVFLSPSPWRYTLRVYRNNPFPAEQAYPVS